MPSRHADWIAQADRDLDHARHSLDDEDFEWSCFAAHQSSEKAVKAVFQRIGAQVIFGHSLADMLTELARTMRVPKALLDSARVLDRHYIPARYPNAHPSGAPFQHYTQREATQAIRHAEKINRFCHSHLS